MAGRFNNKVAVVTGASKGIGAEIARQLGAEGASVVVNYSSSPAGADKVVADIVGGGGKAIAVQANLSKEDDVVRLFAETKKAYGRLDVLVNNAGVYAFAPLEEVTPEFFHRQFDLNVLGLLLATREAAKLMGEGGSIVNISSTVSRVVMLHTSVYTATKAAVDAITQITAAELGPRRIRVNAVNPGMVATEGTSDFISDARTGYEARAPLGRIGQVDDIAPAVLFLASDDAKWITGELQFVAGGYR